MSVSFFSLNIEADRHLDKFSSYLKEKMPDIVFLQEVYKIHAEKLALQFGYHLSFAPHVDFNISEHIFKPLGEWGIATLTKINPSKVKLYYYSEHPVVIPHEFMKTLKHPRALLVTELVIEGKQYCFANTHFT
jgi:endonuclease/exonuclease/phosphatase family metal-dependent hydrolase